MSNSIKQIFTHYERGNRLAGTFKNCPFCCTPLTVMENDHRRRATCPNCGFVQHRNPAPTVSILIVEGDHMLLGKRGGEPGRGTYSFPSGYVDYEEDFLTAAIRETQEETVLDIEICSIINIVSSFISPNFHFLGIYMVARVVGGKLKAGDDLDAVAWFPIAEPPPEMGFQQDLSVLELYRGGFAGLPVDPEYATRVKVGG